MTMRRSSGEESITIFFKQKKFRVFIVQIELKQLRGALVFVVGSGAPCGRRRYDNHHHYFKYCVFVLKQRWGDAWMSCELTAAAAAVLLLYFCPHSDRVVCRLPARCEGPASQPAHSSLPHDHQVWNDPQTSAGTRTTEPPRHRRPWWEDICNTNNVWGRIILC